MVKLEDIHMSTLVHSLGGIVLAGTIALFGYEVTKPGVVQARPRVAVAKRSALAVEKPAAVQIHRLPALSGYYKRKVLAYAVRYRKPGKNFTIPAAKGKPYQVLMAGNSYTVE